MTVLSIDPGSKKCGISVVDNNLDIRELKIVEVEEIQDVILQAFEKYDDINVVILGNKTGSADIEDRIRNIIKNKGVKFVKIEEEFSTQEGKEEFIKRKGFWKALFKDNFDEWASYILVKRFFESGEGNEKEKNRS